MERQEAIDAVRILVQAGEIEPVNVYERLERWGLSGSEIDALLDAWAQGGDDLDDGHLYRLHQAQRQADRAYRYGRPVPVDRRRALADSAEREAAALLAGAGYDVALTPGYHDRHDLTLDGVLRVEVKASTWRPAAGGRWRYAVHFHNEADVLCWLCANTGKWFIIPCEVLDGRRCLAIWSYDPEAYTGQWADYLGAWHIVDRALADAQARGASVAWQGVF